MSHQFTQKELLELELQLSNPTGEKGIEVAQKMYDGNFGMTKLAIDSLHIQPKNSILEIGHGNCEHLPYVLNKALQVSYTGLEISKTMQQIAIKNLNNLVTSLNVNFDVFNGEFIPYKENTFDRIYTINTLYFWKKPQDFLQQIATVLKPNGIFVIAFASKKFMEKLPFVKDRFRLYSKGDFKQLIEKSNLTIVDTIQDKDEVKSKTNEDVTRERLFFILSKNNG